MQNNKMSDKCRGSLVGGAVGDALGYTVEFMTLNSILRQYGERGITDYEPDKEGIAEFSDDTQMTLFTAEGLLSAMAAGAHTVKEILPYIVTAYLNWYCTQTEEPSARPESRLTNIRRLWSQRAPGNTCMSALCSISKDRNRPVMNNSKGCGGIMRVAPIGIYSAAHPDRLPVTEAGILAGQAAEITHRHLLSTYSSMALAMIVAECIGEEEMDRNKFRTIVMERTIAKMASRHDDKNMQQLGELVQQALELAQSDLTDFQAIRRLGEGWVAEETLAIALFSVMRYVDDFERCICSAVNHDGDSDSTGAVAGNIIGAILGYSAIPAKYITGVTATHTATLELHDLLLSVADDLTADRR